MDQYIKLENRDGQIRSNGEGRPDLGKCCERVFSLLIKGTILKASVYAIYFYLTDW